jgi:hypothetical protein
VKCPSCQSSNRPDRRFCGQCGAALVLRCSRCNFSNGPSDRFCGGCGDALDPAATHSDSPRPTPAAAVTRVPPSPPSYGSDMLSSQELGELLKKPAPPPTSSLPNRVTQEDLDRLFGVKP